MRDVKVFRWWVYLVPGILVLGSASTLLLLAGQHPLSAAAGREWHQTAVVVLAVLVFAHVIGMLTWGAAYRLAGPLLWPFYRGFFRDALYKGEHRPRPYQAHRVIEAERVIAEYDGDEPCRPPAKEIARRYRHYQMEFLLATEQRRQWLGPKLNSEWESLGMMNALLLCWYGTYIALLVTSVTYLKQSPQFFRVLGVASLPFLLVFAASTWRPRRASLPSPSFFLRSLRRVVHLSPSILTWTLIATIVYFASIQPLGLLDRDGGTHLRETLSDVDLSCSNHCGVITLVAFALVLTGLGFLQRNKWFARDVALAAIRRRAEPRSISASQSG